MERLLRRVWHSPTLMSWGSLGAKLVGVVLLLPLVLHRFSAADIVLWLMFSTLVSLQILADAGFSQTFSRAIACAVGGATLEELRDMRVAPTPRDASGPSHDTLHRLIGTMRSVYLRLTAGGLVLLCIVGPMVFAKPIRECTDPEMGWMACFFVLLATVISLLGNLYSAYLQGTDRIALLRRWEMLTAIASICTAVAVLLCGGKLFAVVFAQQLWVVLAVLRNWWLCRTDSGFRLGIRSKLDRAVLAVIWPGAWRSGVGVFMSYGLIQMSGMIYAQLESSTAVSSYLLALRMIQTISQFSQAPFYSKLPMLARLRSQGRVAEQIAVASRSMNLSHLTFMAGFIVIGGLGQTLLMAIHSHASFVSPGMWTLLGAAFLAERIGSMHIQLYSTTNHIIWHIANGWTGMAMTATSILLYRFIGIHAFPLAMILSYVCIYCVVSIRHSYRAFGLSLVEFELKASILPVVGGAFTWAVLAIFCFWR